MTDAEFLADVRTLITPAYADKQGTTSWERNRLLSIIDRLRARIEQAPVAYMDTRIALGLCAPTEEDFPVLYALQGRRVRLVLDDDLG